MLNFHISICCNSSIWQYSILVTANILDMTMYSVLFEHTEMRKCNMYFKIKNYLPAILPIQI